MYLACRGSMVLRLVSYTHGGYDKEPVRFAWLKSSKWMPDKTAQEVKTADLNLFPETHMVEDENQFPKVVLSPLHTFCGTCIHVCM